MPQLPVPSILTAEGKYLHLRSILRVASDEKWINREIVPLISVSIQRGVSPAVMIRAIVAGVLCHCAGEIEYANRLAAEREKQNRPPNS